MWSYTKRSYLSARPWDWCSAGDYLDGVGRESFRTAMEISALSYPVLAKAALPLMESRAASILALTYIGSERTVPNYNTMGVCKTATLYLFLVI